MNTYWHATTKMYRSNSHSESLTFLPFQGENSSCSYLQIALDGNKVHVMLSKIAWGAAELLKCQFHKPYKGSNCGKSCELAHQGAVGSLFPQDTPILSLAVRKLVPTAPNEAATMFTEGRKAERPVCVGFSVCWLKAIEYIL